MKIGDIKKMRLIARKSKSAVDANLLGLICGEWETETKSRRLEGESVAPIIKKLTKSVKQSLDASPTDEKLQREYELLLALTPKKAGKEEIETVCQKYKFINMKEMFVVLDLEFGADCYDKSVCREIFLAQDF